MKILLSTAAAAVVQQLTKIYKISAPGEGHHLCTCMEGQCEAFKAEVTHTVTLFKFGQVENGLRVSEFFFKQGSSF